jgi:hypothetical protein
MDQVPSGPVVLLPESAKPASSSLITVSSYSSRQSSYTGHPLTIVSEYASKSAEQQETALQKLGVIHNQTLNIGGISASILEYLVSRESGPRDRIEDIRSLQQDLIKTMYETRTDEDQLRPSSIHLSQTDRERAQSVFIASLQYYGMVDRESRIAMAHESTFRWVFQDNQFQDHQSQMIKWSSFRKWLESDDQLY